MDYQTDCIIETIAVRRRKEEGARLHLHMSFPVSGNGPLAIAAMQQIGNVVDVGFGIMQPPLLNRVETPLDPDEADSLDDEDEDEDVDAGEEIEPHGWEAPADSDSLECDACGIHRDDHPSLEAMQLIAQANAPEEKDWEPPVPATVSIAPEAPAAPEEAPKAPRRHKEAAPHVFIPAPGFSTICNICGYTRGGYDHLTPATSNGNGNSLIPPAEEIEVGPERIDVPEEQRADAERSLANRSRNP